MAGAPGSYPATPETGTSLPVEEHPARAIADNARMANSVFFFMFVTLRPKMSHA
jgi:hypothetical protein